MEQIRNLLLLSIVSQREVVVVEEEAEAELLHIYTHITEDLSVICMCFPVESVSLTAPQILAVPGKIECFLS